MAVPSGRLEWSGRGENPFQADAVAHPGQAGDGPPCLPFSLLLTDHLFVAQPNLQKGKVTS